MRHDRAAETDLLRSPLRVLFFEDCAEDIELCLRTLKSAGFDVTWDQAVTPDAVRHRHGSLRAAEIRG